MASTKVATSEGLEKRLSARFISTLRLRGLDIACISKNGNQIAHLALIAA
jgi:hypothetical protein